MRTTLLTVLSLVCCLAARAQPADTLYLPLGEPVEQVRAASDTTQRYAVYLPAGYRTDRVFPILFLMDPRGRALVPIERFRASAERYGYVLLSSHQTLSDADSAWAVNGRALNAMVQDAQIRFSVDTRRFYIAGFSGTAHYAWFAASFLDGHLAGIVNSGDGLPVTSASVGDALGMTRPPAYFNAAALGDFNYDAARLRDRALDTTRVPHRFVTFPGDHAWLPAALADEAMTWMQYQAMRTGMARYDAPWIDSLRVAHIAEARRLDEAGRYVEAIRRYREVAADFEGRGDISFVRDRIAALESDPAARAAIDMDASITQRIWAYSNVVIQFLDEYRTATRLPRTRLALARLQIPRLQEEAEDARHPDLAAGARRMLATTYGSVAFYEPRDYMAAGDFERAAGLLRVARAMRPDGGACFWLALSEAQLGRADDAIDALTCAIDGQQVTRERIDTEPLLEPLRADRRYAALVARAPK
ncbi:MAG: hypothetical protein R2834_22725 [Rhodothermales bacterium]